MEYTIAWAVITYVLALVSVYVNALIIDALAPSFGGTKNSLKAFKVAAYSGTAAWVAGIFQIIPLLGILGILGLYSLYLLYLGLPRLMAVSADKAIGYTVVVVISWIVVYAVCFWLVGMLVLTFVGGRCRSFRRLPLTEQVGLDGARKGAVQHRGFGPGDVGRKIAVLLMERHGRADRRSARAPAAPTSRAGRGSRCPARPPAARCRRCRRCCPRSRRAGARRRWPCETWSSWLAEVGRLSTLAGWASALFSLASAAAVTCAIMKPELTPPSLDQERRQAGQLRVDQHARCAARRARRSRRAPCAIASAANATGSAWKLPPGDRRRRSSGEHERVVGDRVGLVSSTRAAWRIRSRHAPITCGWQRRL